MTTKDAKGRILSNSEEDFPLYFHEWIKRRRRELDLTQEQLAKLASCSVFAIRKIEMGERRPSSQLAGLLSKALKIPADDQITFIKVARGELSVECLHSRNPVHTSQPPGKPGSIPGNLPRTLTPFIGRKPELTALGELLHDPQCSLLTIVGPGGIGKTRLAIEAAHHTRDLFPDGIWFVPLASLNSPALIVPAIAEAVEFKFQDPTGPQAQLLRYLRAKKALLVLDNAEHLLEGVGVFAEILKACQQVKLLVTSRERLNLLSEWVFEIQGLPVPPSDQVDQFEAYSSVELFVQSAGRVRAGFEIPEDERRWVLKICQILEGIPLGIELSAAWVGLLSVEEIAKEIEHNLDFLAVSMRDLPERHRSLRATLDHSWNLLNPEEKLVLSRLAVFRGRFRREATQEICGASLAVLASLRDKTLLYRTDQEHYALHEIIRQYAGLKLGEDPDEEERIKDRHASYYVQSLAKWENALQSARQVETIEEMAQVIDNLAQGWQRMITHCRPGGGKNNRLCADLLHSALFSLSLFYEMRCRSWEAIPLFTESVEYLKSVQGEFEETEDRSGFISVLGHITAYLGLHHLYIVEYERGRAYLEEAIQWLENSHSRVEKAQAQVMLAWARDIYGQLQEKAVLLEQSREVFREAGEEWWYALTTVKLASAYLSIGKDRESEALFQEGFGLVKPGDLRQELPLRIGFAYIHFIQKDFAEAEQGLQDTLQLSYQLGDNHLTAYILFDLGRVTLAARRIDLAETYLQKSIHLLSIFGESHDLAMVYLYLGKCFAARPDLHAAQAQFRKVIRIGQAIDKFHLVYYGVVNLARMYMLEGQTEKALEIMLLLRRSPIEYITMQEDFDQLYADLQAALPEGQMEAALKQVDGKITPTQARADVLAYVQEHEFG